MYDPKLKVFTEVADCGSFTKAAERLYLSPTAIMKQMNLLEKHIGLQLMKRTRQGIELTPAGISVYRDAKEIINWSDKAIQRACHAQGIDRRVIRVGTSALYPGKRLMDLWEQISGEWPMFRLKIVPFADDSRTMLANLGKRYDLICGVYDSDLTRNQCRFLPLGQYSFCLAMSRQHPLARHEKLAVQDLDDQHLLIMPQGNSPSNDRVRALLSRENPEVIFEDAPRHYDMETFNQCEELGWLLLTVEGWQDIHPSLVTIPLDVPETIPYGVIYAKTPNADTGRFLEILGELNS